MQLTSGLLRLIGGAKPEDLEWIMREVFESPIYLEDHNAA